MYIAQSEDSEKELTIEKMINKDDRMRVIVHGGSPDGEKGVCGGKDL